MERGPRWHTPVDLLALAVAATAMALVWLSEVIGHWSTRTATRGDGQFQAWTIDWVQGAILRQHPLWNAGIYHPSPRSLAFSDHLLGVSAALLPLRALGLSPAAQLNTAIVIGSVLDAWAAYLLIRVLLRRRAPALVAGVAFVAGPFQHQLALQLHMLWRPGLPVAVALVWIVADRRGDVGAWAHLPSDRWLAVLLGVVVAWQGLVSFYDAVSLGLVLVVVVLVRVRHLGRVGVGLVAAATAVGGVLVAFTLPPYLANVRGYEGFKRTLDETVAFRGRLFQVEASNRLWGGLAPVTEGLPAFAGLTLTVLALVGVVAAVVGRRRHGRSAPGWDAARLGIWCVVVGAVLALGASGSGLGRWSPFGVLFRFVPGFSVVRAPGRLWVIGLLGLVVLAARGVVVLVDAIARTAVGRRVPAAITTGLVVLVLAGAVVAEGAAKPEGTGPAARTPIDETLASRPGDGAVLYLPIGESGIGVILNGADDVYRSTTHHRPILNGYSGFAPESTQVLAEELAALPRSSALACLVRTGTDYVVVTPAVLGGPWEPLLDPANAAPLELVQRSGREVLYAVPEGLDVDPADCPLPSP